MQRLEKLKKVGKREICWLAIIVIIGTPFYAQEKKASEVMILGTHHLAQIKGFKPSMVDEVLNHLDDLNFDVIAIEQMPGDLLYDIESRKDSAFSRLLDQVAAQRLMFAERMQEELGISFLEAQEYLGKAQNYSIVTYEKKRQFIAYSIAATDLASAALNYGHLKTQEKKAIETSLGEEITAELQRILSSHNEITQLGIRLAKREELNRLYYIDNLQDETILLKQYPNFIKDYKQNQNRIDSFLNDAFYTKIEKGIKQGIQDENLSNLYRYLNSEEYQERDFQNQWAVWFDTNFNSGSDLARYYLWEMRNLQITSNIARLVAFYPENRILVIIGAAHKSFLEKFLEQISGIRLITY